MAGRRRREWQFLGDPMNHDEFEGLARALFEESGDALMLVDPDTGNIRDANGAAQRLSGFPLRAVIDTPVSEFFRLSAGQWAITFPMPTRTVHLPYAEWGGLFRTFQGDRVPVDVTFTRLNARPHPVALVRVREAASPAGRAPAGAGGARLRHLVAAVTDCLWSAKVSGRDDGQFHFLSPVVEQIAGRSADAIGTPLRAWRDLIHPDDRAAWDEAFERRRSGKATHDEYRLIWPDGSVRWVRDEARVTRAASAGAVWLYGVFADVTEWRQTEASLRRAADLVDSAEDAIISQSADGLIVDWNRGAERLYGYTKDEIRATPVLRLLAPDGESDYSEAVRRARSNQPTESYQATHVRKNGERIEVSIRVSALGADGGISLIARGVDGEAALAAGQVRYAPAVTTGRLGHTV
jgi:PAS domain S-box-containing protein